MIPVSVVIIAKNEAHIIERTIKSVLGLTDDIIIVDSGSTDGTREIVQSLGCKLLQTTWDGFGPNKNKGIKAARYNWILSIDADEMPDAELIKSLQKLNLEENKTVYKILFKTFLGKKLIRYGEWRNDAHIRFFNKNNVHWNHAEVHEQLVYTAEIKTADLKGSILHYSMKDLADFSSKMNDYALLNAEHLYKKGKKAGWIKRNISHRFSFFSNFYLKLGFLDGIEGYWVARVSAQYTFLKYARLHELNRGL